MNVLSSIMSLREKLSGSNIYLVGMMGCGKSQTGPHLAKELGYSFIDIDKVIEEAAKTTISNIFQNEGEVVFRELESQVLKEIGLRHSLVVATGGGLVTKAENWGILHQGIVVWIDPDRDRLLHRIKCDSQPRPLLQANNLVETFDAVLQKRTPIYRQSDLHVIVQDESPKAVAFFILKKLITLLNQKEDSSE